MPHSRLKIEKKVQKQNYWFQCCLICTQKFIHFQKRSQKRKRPFLALKLLLLPDLTWALKNCLYSALIPKYFLLTSLFFFCFRVHLIVNNISDQEILPTIRCIQICHTFCPVQELASSLSWHCFWSFVLVSTTHSFILDILKKIDLQSRSITAIVFENIEMTFATKTARNQAMKYHTKFLT